jgi:GNAT superfamily N-acetyltransferase
VITADAGSSPRWRVRGPHDSDFRCWRELYRGYADFYRTPQPDTAAEQVWSWIRDPHHELNCLLADDGHGHIAGLAHYRAFSRPLSAGTGCYLDDLFVDPAHRGRGAADALLVQLRRLARDNGWNVVRWITAHDNHRAIAKYDQHATRTDWITYDMPPADPADR